LFTSAKIISEARLSHKVESARAILLCLWWLLRLLLVRLLLVGLLLVLLLLHRHAVAWLL
jgi:hypothetical protein